MTLQTKRGFTLIELLVVIAIIGILSSVVLASLNTARQRGADANVKSNFATIAVQADLYYDDNGNYTEVCDDTTIGNALASARSNAVDASVSCNPGEAAYAVGAELRGGGFWCVDSTGFRGASAALAQNATACTPVAE